MIVVVITKVVELVLHDGFEFIMIINCDHNIEMSMGEQQYYEAKVFLKNYREALSTLEYSIHDVEIAPREKPKLKGCKPIRTTWSTE